MVLFDIYGDPIPGGLGAEYFMTGRMSALSSQLYIPPKNSPFQHPRSAFDISQELIEGPKLKPPYLEKPSLPNPLDSALKRDVFLKRSSIDDFMK